MRKVLAAKLHGIHVTETNLHYHGAITLDPEHCEEASILPMEFVEICNKNSRERISTDVIVGQPDSWCCVVNGTASRTCQHVDQTIVCSSSYVHGIEITVPKPKVRAFDHDNRIVDRLAFSIRSGGIGRYHFAIVSEADQTPYRFVRRVRD